MPATLLSARGVRQPHRRYAAACLVSALVVFSLASTLRAQSADESNTPRVTLTILATTDVHGNVWPYDYLRAQPAERGLAKVATYVKQVRARQPNTLVVDCGDTFQGTPLAYLYAEKFTDEPNPIISAMNAIGYDAMAVGNHEFNFGLWTLWRFKEQAEFPILGANVESVYREPTRSFEPYVIRTIGGVRVALLGLVTPSIPYWEPPENIEGYKFLDPVETARRYVPKLRKKADLVIVLIHSGLGRDAETGAPEEQPHPGENRAYELAEQVSGIDAIFFGHTHRQLEGKTVNGTLLVQPKNWAQSVAEADFTLERGSDGHWHLAGRASRVVPMDSSVAADTHILDLTHAAQEKTERYLSTVVAQLSAPLSARTGRVEDGALLDFVQQAQLTYGQADVSLASLFSSSTRWAAGPVTIRDIYSLYFYENTLVTVEVTGAQLKDALEYAARSYRVFPWPAGESPFADPGFNLDMAEGVTYKVDLSRPLGDRIVDLRFQGAPLALGRTLRLAINSYRWAGGGQFEMLRHAKVVQRVDRQVRDLVIDYLSEKKTIDAAVNNNWEIVPEEARQAALDWILQPRAWRLESFPALSLSASR